MAKQKIPSSPVTYKSSGVDIDAGNDFIQEIKELIKSTSRPGCSASLDGFAALCDIGQLGYKDPVLLTSTDGVGTKLKLAQKLGKHNTIGIDLVAMCVNDLLVHAAEPISFLDYFATGKLSKNTDLEVIKGIINGCKQANCALSGGETAEMPGMYQKGSYDLSGFAIGVVERTQLLPHKDLIKTGDTIIGIASSGLHSNGFSLIRKILETYNYSLDQKPPFETEYATLGDALLAPTKIYVGSVLPLMKKGFIKAAAHITGGGLYDNIPRVIPDTLTASIDSRQWPIPPLFQWLYQEHKIDIKEMFRTFNMGIGMMLICDKQRAQYIKTKLCHVGQDAYEIGTVIERKNQSVHINYLERFDQTKNVLVIGSGGREHAMAQALAASPSVKKIFVCPGNGGTQTAGKCTNVDISLKDPAILLSFLKNNLIDLTVVGPEKPLADGIVDLFKQHNQLIVGPTKQAAQVESSKLFAKKFMQKYGIPTADFKVFHSSQDALAFIDEQVDFPLVIKENGLCGGKGVTIARTKKQAKTIIKEKFNETKKNSLPLLIEEHLEGYELSFFIVTDSTTYKVLPSATDYKTLKAGTHQPMTGGMGAVSAEIDPDLYECIITTIVEPTLNGLKKEEIDYTGFLYFGLIINNGKPYVIEFNCRHGDPEAQATLVRLQTDFFALCNATATNTLSTIDVYWHITPSVTLVLASPGYPHQTKIGLSISGYEKIEGITLIHAGTKRTNDRLFTSGGRVLSLTSIAPSVKEAKEKVYTAASRIFWDGMYYRKDIGSTKTQTQEKGNS